MESKFEPGFAWPTQLDHPVCAACEQRRKQKERSETMRREHAEFLKTPMGMAYTAAAKALDLMRGDFECDGRGAMAFSLLQSFNAWEIFSQSIRSQTHSLGSDIQSMLATGRDPNDGLIQWEHRELIRLSRAAKFVLKQTDDLIAAAA